MTPPKPETPALDVMLDAADWYAPRVHMQSTRDNTLFARNLIHGRDLDAARAELSALKAAPSARDAALTADMLVVMRDAALEKSAAIVEHVARTLPLGWGSASGGVVSQAAAERIRALKGKPL